MLLRDNLRRFVLKSIARSFDGIRLAVACRSQRYGLPCARSGTPIRTAGIPVPAGGRSVCWSGRPGAYAVDADPGSAIHRHPEADQRWRMIGCPVVLRQLDRGRLAIVAIIPDVSTFRIPCRGELHHEGGHDCLPHPGHAGGCSVSSVRGVDSAGARGQLCRRFRVDLGGWADRLIHGRKQGSPRWCRLAPRPRCVIFWRRRLDDFPAGLRGADRSRGDREHRSADRLLPWPRRMGANPGTAACRAQAPEAARPSGRCRPALRQAAAMRTPSHGLVGSRSGTGGLRGGDRSARIPATPAAVRTIAWPGDYLPADPAPEASSTP